MKKPKIKPEVLWMPWSEWTGFLIDECHCYRDICLKRFVDKNDDDWSKLRKQGWRIVKVEVREVK